MHSAGAIQPCASMSRHGTSYRLGPMSENTSPSRPSSRTSVAVRPRRRRDCRSAVMRKTGAGNRCTSSYTTRPQSRESNRSRWRYSPLDLRVITWYVAMVTGRISLRSPEYSPISSSVSDVRAISSRFHCRPATVFVTRISVVALAYAIAAAPTSVLPAPQGSTTTPDPPAQNVSAACRWYSRSSQPFSSSSIGCASPSTYPAKSSAGQPTFSSTCLRRPRSLGCTMTVSSSRRSPSIGAIFLCRSTSSSTARSMVCITRPCAGWFVSCSRPKRPIVSTMSISSGCGTG